MKFKQRILASTPASPSDRIDEMRRILRDLDGYIPYGRVSATIHREGAVMRVNYAFTASDLEVAGYGPDAGHSNSNLARKRGIDIDHLISKGYTGSGKIEDIIYYALRPKLPPDGKIYITSSGLADMYTKVQVTVTLSEIKPERFKVDESVIKQFNNRLLRRFMRNGTVRDGTIVYKGRRYTYDISDIGKVTMYDDSGNLLDSVYISKRGNDAREAADILWTIAEFGHRLNDDYYDSIDK